MKNFYLSILILSLAIPCESGYESFMDSCYLSSDVDFVRDVLNNSIETVNLEMDDPSWFPSTSMGNGNGIVEPLEICSQTWENGRLISLDCGAHEINGVYHWCQLSGDLPESLINLTELETLILDYNDFSGFIPEYICTLDFDFSDYSTFSLNGNNFCPPYPQCIEPYMGWQDSQGCELSECYDVGVRDFISFEINGDNVLNTYEDFVGEAYLGFHIYNDGPDCFQYPGVKVTSDTPGVSFYGYGNGDEIFETWWYGMFSQQEEGFFIGFDVSPYIPEGTVITFTAEATTLHCEDDCTESDDPYCDECPPTDPISISLTVGENFTNSLGDSNLDGEINVLDIVETVNYIISSDSHYYYDLAFLMSDINIDSQVNVQDVVLIVNLILSS